MTNKPVLKTAGELLLEARQAAGLELDLVAERTKIPVAILRSLELDEYHKISGPLYVNSFLRTYADELELDTAQVLEAYIKFSGEVVTTGPAPDPEAVWVDEEVSISRVGAPWGMIGTAAGVVVVLVILIVWLTSQRGCSAGDPEFESGAESSLIQESLPAGPLPSSSIPAGESGSGDSVTDLPDAVVDASDVGLSGQEDQAPPVVQEDPPVSPLPEAMAGNAGILFQDGRRWPVVLRLLCDEPVGAQVVRDGDRSFMEAIWSAPGESCPVLGSEGIRHGRPYQSRQGLVVYWGARDQFSLKLDRTNGVEISLNGRMRDFKDLLPGQEIILFVPKSRRNSGS